MCSLDNIFYTDTLLDIVSHRAHRANRELGYTQGICALCSLRDIFETYF